MDRPALHVGVAEARYLRDSPGDRNARILEKRERGSGLDDPAVRVGGEALHSEFDDAVLSRIEARRLDVQRDARDDADFNPGSPRALETAEAALDTKVGMTPEHASERLHLHRNAHHALDAQARCSMMTAEAFRSGGARLDGKDRR